MYEQLDLPGEWVLLLQLLAALNTGRFGPLALHHALISEVIRCGQFLSKHVETLAVADEKPNQQNVTKVQVTLKIIPVRCFIEANQYGSRIFWVTKTFYWITGNHVICVIW